MPRVAIAVRAGDEVLGSIWAAVAGPLSEERTEALRDAAKLVALHLLRVRAGADVQRRLRADLLSSALEGGAGAREALDRLGLAGQPLLVLGVALAERRRPAPTTAPRSPTSAQRLSDAFAHAPAAPSTRGRPPPLIGGVAYGLLPVPAPAPTAEAARACASPHDFLDRVGDRLPAGGRRRAGRAATSPGWPHARAGADRALRVLREAPRRPAGRPASTTSRSRRCCSSCATWPPPAATGRPARSPGSSTTTASTAANLVATLRAWLDALRRRRRRRRVARSCTRTRSATGCAAWPRSASIDLRDPDAAVRRDAAARRPGGAPMRVVDAVIVLAVLAVGWLGYRDGLVRALWALVGVLSARR